MQRLHASSYTYEQYPGGPKSWIDHVLMPSWLLHKVNNITIGYDYVSSDHFPLFCDIYSNILKSRLTASLNEKISANNPSSGSLKCTIYVNWDMVSHYERENFVNTFSNNLWSIKVPYCAVQQGDTHDPKLYERACKHEQYIDNYFYDIVNAYSDAACVSLPMRRCVAKHEAQVVGWSNFVHDLRGAAWVSYVQWREANRPREGALFDEMNKFGRLFKTALRRCRQNRTRIESDKLASAMLKKDSKEFWKGVRRKHAADKTANINEIDNVCDANNIVNVWKEKYVSIYNRGDFSCDKKRLSTRLNDDCDNNVNDMVVSNSAVICALDKL